MLKQGLLDLARVEGELGIANQQIDNLLSRIADYKQKEANWEKERVAFTAERATYVKDISALEDTIKQQKREITKGKITSWTAPIGVTLVATAVILPIMLAK